jgi:crotonobetainyl-CoA:carnitine CoA-transferase CaiB-like acyl-CoA transferase
MNALEGLKIVDLTRVLAGPICTQMLGDLGADVIKIERKGLGDDTRAWGPPFLKDQNGQDTSESAYYLSANRNKKSITLDLSNADDLKKLHALLQDADVLVENFKKGSLEKLGLGYEQLKTLYPRLIYCSITGFGQTGPLSSEPGYDFMIQGMCGLMANTGEINGTPSKAGVAVVDYVTGQNATIGILTALQARARTGKGQLVDVALLDSALAMMTNLAQFTLTSVENPKRVGNAHTTIVPYNAFKAQDGWIIIAIGNEHQFKKFANFVGHPEWTTDPRFMTNSARVTNRYTITQAIEDIIAKAPCQYWIDGLLGVDVPCGPILNVKEAFATAQAKARDMTIEMPHKYGRIKLVGCPIKLSETPATYRLPPPTNGQDNQSGAP